MKNGNSRQLHTVFVGECGIAAFSLFLSSFHDGAFSIYYVRRKSQESGGRCGKMEGMEYIDLRKAGREGLKEIRRQVVRLRELGKTGKEIEELTGVRQNRASEIWTAYQREGSASLERRKYGRKPGSHMALTPEEQENVRKTIVEKVPEEFGITGRLWTLGRTREYIRKEFHKTISERRCQIT